MRRVFRGIGPLLPAGTRMSDQESSDWYEEHSWDSSRYDGLSLERDLAPASWLEPLLSPHSFDVSMTAPRGYEAYARIFFPFVLQDSARTASRGAHPLDGKGTAKGKVAHALMEQETISSTSDEPGTGDQCSHQLGTDQFQSPPSDTRPSHTASTEGCFLLWDGFGDLNRSVFNAGVPKVHHSIRDSTCCRDPSPPTQRSQTIRAICGRTMGLVPVHRY